MYTAFTYPLKTHYHANLCSKVTVFYLIVTILTFIPPLLIAYRSQGFWQKIDTFQEQPDIHFQHELIVLMETADPDNSFGWSTMDNFNEILDDKVKIPTLKSTETDWNRDGKLDWLDLKIEMPASDLQAIYGIQLFVIFDVKLYVSTYSKVSNKRTVYAY